MKDKVTSAMKKHNPRLALTLCALLAGGCEALEGERRVVPAAHLSLFLPANWEASPGEAPVLLEAAPRGVKGVKVQLLIEPRATANLEDMQKHAVLEVQELARKNGLEVTEVTQIPQQRGHVRGTRFVHQLRASKAQLSLTHIADLLPLDGKAVVLQAIGAREQVETVGSELDRLLASVRSLTPEPEATRTYPPDALTGASQRIVQRWLMPLAR